MTISEASLLGAMHDAATAVRSALDGLADWGLTGTAPGQHHSDLAADAAAIAVLLRAGVAVMSEESGVHAGERAIVVVLDPLDGSTNASRSLPWYATSLCAVDRDGARAAVVVDQASGQRFEATRGGGARVDGTPLRPSDCTALSEAVVGLSGHPPRPLGWRQFRALGAIALDLCALAGGRLDGYVDCLPDAHGPWDYLGGMLICREAGAPVVDAFDRDLVTTDHAARRTPVAAATAEVLERLVAARRTFAAEEGWEGEETLLT